ncbi:uncharacterized protein LOC111261690 isoform X1 [Varroa jacobsoni]|uniref:uncharacterized protein LOC111261690 isoform X1 n=1 Tax=Varroa jacobsoni TaxID=62625 RepID=UPI000BF5B3F5|nr:uncharacterized protein LOC111261690 isoform X1 [Varroa jacobsoni]XP_022691088.1 uncharacterized protein LOC111261690 isoform X1 [Varroa jacobsoni]XP_022691089.1 uncharacterized protein LOC111261690 isoform X1 [Varroa jacobsoni]XP_022691090.1 uncharacterized protein LOC111261690 isoform X1 [Varroa jacobsoni]XP_022691091.1 uncharacterized protein LOC111261690 isoform X1 [Varroa jacobsoni]XP_022691093.1 uncharacterized protein LOC111261690 isoform X1 [Varroa jacobsoni]XP_022691094.1 uncharac
MHSTRSVILCALLMTIFVDGITASGEYHANEGGKFSAFKSQADFAEKQLRKTLNLMPEDEVHTASVAMQENAPHAIASLWEIPKIVLVNHLRIKDGHIFNVTMYVKNVQSCSVIVHERQEGEPLEIIKEADKIASCVDLWGDDTRFEVPPGSV